MFGVLGLGYTASRRAAGYPDRMVFTLDFHGPGDYIAYFFVLRLSDDSKQNPIIIRRACLSYDMT